MNQLKLVISVLCLASQIASGQNLVKDYFFGLPDFFGPPDLGPGASA